MDQVISNFRRFHPKPEEIFCSDPQEEPEFIKPYFGLRLFPVWHVGTDYLSEILRVEKEEELRILAAEKAAAVVSPS